MGLWQSSFGGFSGAADLFSAVFTRAALDAAQFPENFFDQFRPPRI